MNGQNGQPLDRSTLEIALLWSASDQTGAEHQKTRDVGDDAYANGCQPTRRRFSSPLFRASTDCDRDRRRSLNVSLCISSLGNRLRSS